MHLDVYGDTAPSRSIVSYDVSRAQERRASTELTSPSTPNSWHSARTSTSWPAASSQVVSCSALEARRRPLLPLTCDIPAAFGGYRAGVFLVTLLTRSASLIHPLAPDHCTGGRMTTACFSLRRKLA